VVVGSKLSVGQVGEEPVQFSAESQDPAEARQTVEEETRVQTEVQQYPGCPLLDPMSHCSYWATTSSPHTPLQNISTPVHCPVPSQVEFCVQLLLSSQGVALASYWVAGQLVPVPVHIVGRTQGPGEGEHTTEELDRTSAGHVGVDPEQYSGTSQTPAEGQHNEVVGSRAQDELQQMPDCPFEAP